VTRYRLDGPGIESWWGANISTPVKTSLGAHPDSYIMATRSFLGYSGRDVVLTTHPHPVPRLKKE